MMTREKTYSSFSAGTIKRWFRFALFNLFLAASIGLLLRFAFVNEIKWLNYKSFQNTHSTLALLGWGFIGFFAFLTGALISPETRQKKIY